MSRRTTRAAITGTAWGDGADAGDAAPALPVDCAGPSALFEEPSRKNPTAATAVMVSTNTIRFIRSSLFRIHASSGRQLCHARSGRMFQPHDGGLVIIPGIRKVL